jgi:hypothetical protein
MLTLCSETYTDAPEITIADLRLVQKSKRCGKPNCDKCPHAGYWYLVAAADQARAGRRREIYLGRSWNERTLLDVAEGFRAEIASKLKALCQASIAARERERLLAEIEGLSSVAAELATERDYAVQTAQAACQQAISQAEREYRTEASAVQTRLRALQTQLSNLEQKTTRRQR